MQVLTVLSILGCLAVQQEPKQVTPTPLTAEQQAAQLKQRAAWSSIGNTFDSFCTSAFTFSGVLLFSDLKGVGKVELVNPFPDSYKPTWREILDTLARQTQTSWSYSNKHGGWLFDKPALPLQFTIDLAKDWKQEDRGFYVFHKPPDVPVGMDVYQFGRYSFDKDADKECLKIRDRIALTLLEQISPKTKVEDMRKVAIDGTEALFFETPSPREGVTWRQWVFVKDGRAFGIVSALEDDKESLLKDVQRMVATFKLKKDEKTR